MSAGESYFQCLDRLSETPIHSLWEPDTLFVVPLPPDHGHVYVDLEVNLLFLDSIFSAVFNKQTSTHIHACKHLYLEHISLKVWEMEEA